MGYSMKLLIRRILDYILSALGIMLILSALLAWFYVTRLRPGIEWTFEEYEYGWTTWKFRFSGEREFPYRHYTIPLLIGGVLSLVIGMRRQIFSLIFYGDI